MKTDPYCKLDNPVWHSLNETHRMFAITYGTLKCYQPNCCVFGGVDGRAANAAELDHYAAITSSFFVVGEEPAYSPSVAVVKELVCLQNDFGTGNNC